jgi:hypothetical protein
MKDGKRNENVKNYIRAMSKQKEVVSVTINVFV